MQGNAMKCKEMQENASNASNASKSIKSSKSSKSSTSVNRRIFSLVLVLVALTGRNATPTSVTD
jgi:hypothetical protein